jgi:hypothetical protein
MQKSRLWRGTAVIAAACGLAGAGAGTAVAAPGGHAAAAAPSITITTKSGLPKVSGHTLVTFLGTQRTATVSGSVTGAAAGDQATLLAEPHGVHAYSQVGAPVTLTSASAYSFKVTPSVATSYEVQVGSGTSVAAMVYVTPHASVTGKRSCTRPVCHIKLRVWVKVASAAYAKEAAKHWYLYSRLRLSATREPAAFKALELNHGATASKATKLHSYEFVVTLRYTFKIGNDAFRWAVNFCTKDSETADGIGLPGTHGCGNKWISATSAYLG